MAMATRNSERFIERTLSSINKTFDGSGRHYALVIADDSSSDRTLTLARRFQSSASYRSTLGFPKASCVGESKNRASLMARPFLQQFPWVLWMDDDDEMLHGRLQLIDKMEENGQKAAVGDWVHSFDDGSRKEYVTGDWSITNRCFSPCMTAIHGSLIPEDGKYFHHAPTDVYEDLSTHSLMTHNGVQWCYHGGFNIHVYHRRDDSWSGTGHRSHEILKNSVEYMRRFRNQTNIRSFCTVAIGSHAISELRLMIMTMRLHNNWQPVVIITDNQGADEINSIDFTPVDRGEIIITIHDSFEEDAKKFPGWDTKYSAKNLKPEAMLAKMRVIRDAVNRFGSTLFIDADQIFLREINEHVSQPVGLVHEGPNTMTWPMGSSDWSIQFLGAYNGGMAYFDRRGLDSVDMWEKDYLESYIWCGDDSKPHGGFSDQTSLEVLAASRPIHTFHRGYGVSAYRLERGLWPEIKSGAITFQHGTSISGSHDLFYQGWPMMTIHQHFRGSFWNSDGRELFTAALSRSMNEKHKQTLAWILDGQSPEQSSLSRRARVRYLTQKVTA